MDKIGGGVCSRELRTDIEACSQSNLFSVNFLQLFHSSPFGLTLVEILAVMVIIGVLTVLLLSAVQTNIIALFSGRISNTLRVAARTSLINKNTKPSACYGF
ncbi:MAG: prepilin-type N-terminal cleavage/methylation domain-containing protein [Planctomycetaceae bacterium]|nr:prepilin-type N-terminal cleavage/methylation domain-containing protein [Planctomycetaceae bacterium]